MRSRSSDLSPDSTCTMKRRLETFLHDEAYRSSRSRFVLDLILVLLLTYLFGHHLVIERMIQKKKDKDLPYSPFSFSLLNQTPPAARGNTLLPQREGARRRGAGGGGGEEEEERGGGGEEEEEEEEEEKKSFYLQSRDEIGGAHEEQAACDEADSTTCLSISVSIVLALESHISSFLIRNSV
ncbi:unnamed protein product [Pleuronectes platessa]|uniref:Uncharacterized protein n=1 Tax=Pleuronectes platessa TaxID=8262 RepID=A0A9N7TKL3_PLEPL|nr:unnamed protein product [Pleuronectes platessa]